MPNKLKIMTYSTEKEIKFQKKKNTHMYVIDSCHSGTSTSSKLMREGGFIKALY